MRTRSILSLCLRKFSNSFRFLHRSKNKQKTPVHFMGRAFNRLNNPCSISTNMPKPLSGKILKLEVRVTPYDQEPIVIDDNDLQNIDKLVLCREGTPNGVPRLHYHGYIETKKSESWLRSFLKKIAHAPDNEKVNGNSLYFTRKPHDHTFGYIIKSGNIDYRHGFTQATLDEWLAESSQYAKDKATERKRKQRTRNDELAEIVELIEKDLKDNSISRSVASIVDRFLAICFAENIRFPTRSQMDMYVLQLIHPYDQFMVRSFYMRSFEGIRT